MSGKQAIGHFVTILLFFSAFKVLPTNGEIISPWSDKKMQSDLMNCVYIGMISDPHLLMMPLQAIDDIKWKMLSYSDSIASMSYLDKKVAMDDKFGSVMADAIKQNNFQNNPVTIDVISKLGGNCYSSVTGYDSEVVAQEIKSQVKENIEKSSAPLGGDPNSVPFPAYQNQQFQPPSQIQPSYVNNAPLNPPSLPPANSFNNPQYGNGVPFNPPVKSPANSYDYPQYGNDAPFIPPVKPPANSYDYPQYGDDVPLNPPASAPVNSFNNPPYQYDYPYYPSALPSVNPSSNSSLVNNATGTSETKPSNNDDGRGQAIRDFSQSQASTDDSSGPSFQINNKSFTKISLDNTALATTTSPRTSSQSQTSKPPKADTLGWTTPSPQTDAPPKITENEKSKDEVPCDEKFKTALYDRLINDYRFSIFFGKLPGSSTKPAVLEIMNRAFNKYGIQQHFTEFKTFWKFDSKTLNKESSVEDWDEVISKICKIIFSRNHLLKGDCEKIGIEIADYILQVLPGDPPTSSTQAPNQNDGEDDASGESNANSTSNSSKYSSPASNMTTKASPVNALDSANSKDSSNLSFPELNSKLSDLFNNAGTTKQDSDDVPLSETLSAFEAKQNLETLYSAAESCLSPSGFDLEKFMSTMSDVTDSIQKNHPDWSHDKCQKEMYAVTVAVMADLLQKTAKSSSDDAESQSSSDQSADDDTSASGSLDSDASYDVPNEDYSDSDDSSYPVPSDEYASDSYPQQQGDISNYKDYPDAPGIANVPPYGNQPGPGGWNPGLTQPSNVAPNPLDKPYSANRPYNSNYGSQDYSPVISQPMPKNLPSQDYPAIAPAYSGKQPFAGNQNNGFQQPPNSGFVNPTNGNGRFQPQNLRNNNGLNGAQPVVSNNNPQKFKPQSYQNYDYGAPNGNIQPGLNTNYNSRFPNNGQAYKQW